MEWDALKARKYLYNLGMDHIKDGLRAEGADLIYAANFDGSIMTRPYFISTIKQICQWEDKEIEVAAREAMLPAFL